MKYEIIDLRLKQTCKSSLLICGNKKHFLSHISHPASHISRAISQISRLN